MFTDPLHAEFIAGDLSKIITVSQVELGAVLVPGASHGTVPDVSTGSTRIPLVTLTSTVTTSGFRLAAVAYVHAELKAARGQGP
ncbi:hypothetical protein GCM10023321_12860 [Pseudonocardia eucalypti]|uniref:Uncharacterized protein n=1 Tax=Pseudonocardia eucalypti TaxID=648755 RepID=A0ABP9PN64_9PSEU